LDEAPVTESPPEGQPSEENGIEPSATQPESDTLSVASDEQDRRARRVWLMLWIGGGIVLILFLLAFWPVMRGRLDAAKQLDEAQALLKQARGSVSDVDRVVAQQLSADPSVATPDVSPQVLVARRELTQIDALVDDAMPHLTEDEQRRATLVRDAADARLAMLESAPTMLKTSARSATSLEPANAAWQEAQLANHSEASANAQYGKQTALGVRTSADLYARAAAQLKSGNSLYSQAASAFPEAGYIRYADQGNLRINALRLATASTASWLAGNRALAKAQHAQYVAQSAKAEAAAKALPAPPGRAGGDAFEQIAGRSRQAYEAARAKAVAADEALSSL
jgi:hypothetical protein